jgi:hypothetical protein
MMMAGPYHQPTTLEEVRTLWIGDLQYWADENYLYSCFAHTGEVGFRPINSYLLLMVSIPLGCSCFQVPALPTPVDAVSSI